MSSDDDKRLNFKRLATNRVNNAVNVLRLIGNLSNTNNYSFSEDDVNALFNAIEDELKLTKSRFALSLKRRNKVKF